MRNIAKEENLPRKPEAYTIEVQVDVKKYCNQHRRYVITEWLKERRLLIVS